MKKTILTTVTFLIFALVAQAADNKLSVQSPNGKLSIVAELTTGGTPVYSVRSNGQTVIMLSSLGLKTDVDDFTKKVKILSISPVTLLKETYNSPAEKRANRTYQANYARLTLVSATKKLLKIEFKATNEGVAFRYLMSDRTPIAVKSENTTFKFSPSTKAWMHPYAKVKDGWCETQPSYEEQYEYEIPVGTPSTLGVGWTFPALFHSDKNWVLITEAGLTPDYAGTHLAHLSENGEYSIAFPQKGETVKPTDLEYPVSANITSPWRVIVVGSLATVVESQMVSDMAKPADKAVDYSWVKTGIASWSWGVLHDESVNYNTSKQFIEYASDMKWDYCLIDADWTDALAMTKLKNLRTMPKQKK